MTFCDPPTGCYSFMHAALQCGATPRHSEQRGGLLRQPNACPPILDETLPKSCRFGGIGNCCKLSPPIEMKPGVHFHREALRLVLVNGSSMLTRAPVAPTLMKQVPVFGSECIEVLGRDPTTHPAWKEAAAAQSQASDTRAALVSKFKLRYGKKLDEDIAAEKAAADAAKAKQRPSLLSVLTSKNVQLDSAVLAAMKNPAKLVLGKSAAAQKSQ